MKIPEKLKNGDPFKRTTVDAVNEIIDYLRAQSQQQPSAPRGGYRQFTETDFMVSKVRLANKNDALAVNGGTLRVGGGFSAYSDFIFDPVMLDISALANGNYHVVAIVYYASGWKKKIIFCGGTTVSKLFCNAPGFESIFCVDLGVITKATASDTDPETGDPITAHRITYIGTPNKNPSFHPGVNVALPFLRLTLSALSSTMADGYLLQDSDFSAATVALWNFKVIRYESNGGITAMSVSGTGTMAYSGTSYTRIALVNAGTFASPSLSVQIYESIPPSYPYVDIYNLNGSMTLGFSSISLNGAFPIAPPILVFAKGNFT